MLANTMREPARLRVGLDSGCISNSPLSDTRAEPIAEPHERIVSDYEGLVQSLIKPPLASKFWIPADPVYSATPEDPIVAVMGHMVDHSFSHVPILEDGRVAGVFCEWTPLETARDTGELLIDARAPFIEPRPLACA